MIPFNRYMEALQRNISRVRVYKLGCDGSDGECDCIGLPIGAVRLAGGSWKGTHGSNYAARNMMRNLRPAAEGVHLGELVFKSHEPGEDGYALPKSYWGGGDDRDYYHVGVVTCEAPLEITHCTSVQGGIKRDTSLGKWKWAGELALVDYTRGDEPVMIATVTRTPDSTGTLVNVRKAPDTGSQRLGSVPFGEKVNVVAVQDGWAFIKYDNAYGYMMAKYLAFEPDDGQEDDTPMDAKALAKSIYELIKPYLD